MAKVKLIAVSPEVYDSLRRFGNFQESFNDVITKILDKVDAMPKQELKINKNVTGSQAQQQEVFEDTRPRNNPTDKEGFES